MPRQKAQDPEARRRILQAAETRFAEQEYSSTSVRAIAQAAGVTVPVIYYYFDSKEGLYRAVIEAGFAQLADLLEKASVPGDSRSELTAMVWGFFKFYRQDKARVRLVTRLMAGADRAAPKLDYWRGFRMAHEAIMDVVTTGQRRGEIAQYDADEMTVALLGIAGEHARLHLRGKARLSRALAERTVDLVLRGAHSTTSTKPSDDQV